MNNNSRMRKFLAVAACIAVVGNTANLAHAENLNISVGTTANANNGKITTIDMPDGEKVWQKDDPASVNANLSGGMLNVENFSQSVVNGNLNATSGNLNLKNGTLTIDSNSNIGKDVKTNLNDNSILNVSGGTVSLDTNDTWNGMVGVENGTLTVETNKNNSGSFIQAGGTTNIHSNFDMTNGLDEVSKGTINIGSTSKNATVTMRNSTISQDANVNLEAGSKIELNNGNLNLGNDDSWRGTVNVTGGNLALVGIQKSPDAVLTQNAGTTNVFEKSFDLNNTSDLIDGGILNIGDGTTSSKLNVSKGTITSDATVNINEKGSLNIKGGNVSLDSEDTVNGNVNISGGELSLSNVSKNANGTFTQTNGKTTITGKNFDLNNGNDYVAGGDLVVGNGITSSQITVSQGAISKDTNVNIKEHSSVNITGGNVDLSTGSTWDGNINITDGNLILNDATKNPTGVFTQSGGKTTVVGKGLDLDNSEDIVSGGILNIGNKTTETELNVSQGYIDSDAKVNVNRNGSLIISGGEASLDKNDTWQGNVSVTDGNLSITDINKKANGTFTQTGGETTITSNIFELNNTADNISGGTLNVTGNTNLHVSKGQIGADAIVNLDTGTSLNVSGGSAALDNTDSWNGNVNVSGGSLALIGISNKNGTFTQTRGTTTVTESGFDLNSNEDKISGGKIQIGDGNTISDMSVSQGSIGKNATVDIQSGGSLNINGGNVDLGKNTVWNGSVNVSDGVLNIENAQKNPEGNYAQNGGITTVLGSGFNLNNASDNVSGGTLNIGNGTTLTTVQVSEGTIHANANTNVNSNSTLSINGGKVYLNENDKWDGKVTVNGGNLALVGINKSKDAIITQSGGITTVTGNAFDLNNTSDNLKDGVLNVGTDPEISSMEVSKGTIAGTMQTNIAVGSEINITGGSVTLDANDNWNGKVNVSSGNLKLDGINKSPSGILTQKSGTTTITNVGNTLNNKEDNIAGGNLIIGTNAKAGELNIENGTIQADASVTINNDGVLNIKGGKTTIDGNNDRWNGKVNISDGTLNLVSNRQPHGIFTQSGGTTNVDNSLLTLGEKDEITGGSLNLNSTGELTVNNGKTNTSDLNSTGGQITIKGDSKYISTGGTVDEASKVILDKNSTLGIDGETANVTLDGASDTVTGHVNINKGTLNIKNGLQKETTSSGNFVQTGGTTNISGTSKITLKDTNSSISGGDVNVSEGSTLAINNGSKNSSNLNVTASNFELNNKSSYTTTGGTISKDSNVVIGTGSKLAINGETANVSLNGNKDKVNGSLELSKGTLNLSEDLSKVTTADGHYIQTGGEMLMDKSSLTLADENSLISGGKVNLQNNSVLTVSNSAGKITGGNISIDDTSALNYLSTNGLIQDTEDNINIASSGLVNLANGVTNDNFINSLTIKNGEGGSGTANFAIDIKANGNGLYSTDTINANAIKVETSDNVGTIRISDFNLAGDIYGYDAPIDRQIRLGKIFKSDDIDKEITFAATDKEVATPIGYYRMNAGLGGNYTLDLSRFNPAVFRGQVSSMSAYMSQLTVNDTLFNRAQIRRFGASPSDTFKNRTAVIEGNTSYEKTLRDGQIWTEVYGNFGHFKLDQSIGKVHNNSWGFIAGGDFGLRELKNGWSWMPTAYIAYNGGHQSYQGIGMNQNGGQIGFMGTFMNDKFTHSALGYVGLYGTEMNIAATSEDTFNYFFGFAERSSYDWKIGSHFKIQPTLTLAYNMFGQQNWHSEYGQMSMSAGFLNGFNVAPGVNFVVEHETWNSYATIAYAWNFFSGNDGYAGNVGLPDVDVDKNGYLQYGFGFSKMFSDSFNMYAQATIRNLGRTGIICQGGLNWRI